MSYKAKLKGIIKEMYQIRPILAYLGGRASDTLSTYFAFLKGYPIDKETNEMLKLLLQELGIESGLLLH